MTKEEAKSKLKEVVVKQNLHENPNWEGYLYETELARQALGVSRMTDLPIEDYFKLIDDIREEAGMSRIYD